MSETIQIGILVTLLKPQNMKNTLIYLKVNLFLHNSSLELLKVLQQNNNFSYIYVENNHFIPHNQIYIKRIYYKYIFTAQLNTLACIYILFYENLIFN